jgi:hypothetical protein
MPQQTFTLPDGRAWALPEFVRTPAEAAERDRLLAGRFYLVRQGSLGEIFRCGRCKNRHTYLTLMCIEQPFSGITEGLWAYYQAAGTPQAFLRMTPDEQRRVESVRRFLGPSAGLPDLSAGHPQFARGLSVDERDIEVGAVPMGVLEEIPASLAQRFVDRINGQLPIDARLSLPGLTA